MFLAPFAVKSVLARAGRAFNRKGPEEKPRSSLRKSISALRQSHLGRVQVDDLPSGGGLMQDNGSPVQKSRAIVQVEGGDGGVAQHLNRQATGLDVHVGRYRPSSSDLLEDDLERLLKFSAPNGPLRKGTRIEDGRIVIECRAEAFPIEIFESVNELRQGCADFGLRQ